MAECHIDDKIADIPRQWYLCISFRTTAHREWSTLVTARLPAARLTILDRLVQVRMSTVDSIAQRLLQPPKQVLHSRRPPLFSSGDGDFDDIWLHLR